MKPLADYPEVRRYLYLAQFIVAGVFLLIGVGFAAASMDFPTWYAVASALWSYLGLTAASNTPTAPSRGQPNWHDERHPAEPASPTRVRRCTSWMSPDPAHLLHR